MQATTDKSTPNYVAPEDRIATFDQDGTTWVEHPIYTQVMYRLDHVKVIAASEASGMEEDRYHSRR